LYGPKDADLEKLAQDFSHFGKQVRIAAAWAAGRQF